MEAGVILCAGRTPITTSVSPIDDYGLIFEEHVPFGEELYVVTDADHQLTKVLGGATLVNVPPHVAVVNNGTTSVQRHLSDGSRCVHIAGNMHRVKHARGGDL